MYLEMKVFGVTVDPFTNVPIVILKDSDEKNALPVWIGVLEASAIASELEKIHFSRPMTHDLLKEVLKNLDVTVKKIEVNDLKDNVYYAAIHMAGKSGSFILDARPSDAIALALRMGAPIFVDTCVLEKSRSMDLGKGHGKKDSGSVDLADTLDDLPPEDFGKYKM
ncbi:MAG: bifunctional nuclease family protein [Deltaproteobacteria bacterium]|nr:bifunctional nuclease family protein [Deltaproteobacteria bacterium]